MPSYRWPVRALPQTRRPPFPTCDSRPEVLQYAVVSQFALTRYFHIAIPTLRHCAFLWPNFIRANYPVPRLTCEVLRFDCENCKTSNSRCKYQHTFFGPTGAAYGPLTHGGVRDVARHLLTASAFDWPAQEPRAGKCPVLLESKPLRRVGEVLLGVRSVCC